MDIVRTPTVESERVPAREVMRARIVDLAAAGRLHPGELTSENEIAEILGEGRTPVREALALLAGEGMFDQVPQKGIRLRPLTHGDAEASLAIRTRLETLVAETFAGREDRLDRLAPSTEAFRAMSLAVFKEPGGFAPAYAQFHVALAQGAGYRTAAFSLRTCLDLLRLYQAEQDRLGPLMEPAQPVPPVQRTSKHRGPVVDLREERISLAPDPGERDRLQIVTEEIAILEGIKSGDPVRAGKAVVRHLRESAKRLMPGRKRARATEATDDLLLSSAGYFDRCHVAEAAGLAVTRVAIGCVARRQYTQAAKILGTRYVQIGSPWAAKRATDEVRVALGNKFDSAFRLGSRITSVEDLQTLLSQG